MTGIWMWLRSLSLEQTQHGPGLRIRLGQNRQTRLLQHLAALLDAQGLLAVVASAQRGQG